MKNTILVIAAHPDDEVIGCGGTMARHIDAGDEVHVIFVADGETSRKDAALKDLENREHAAKKSSDILGVKSCSFLRLPDNRLDSLPLLEIVQPIEKLLSNIQPSIIYTHHGGDLNIDHRVTFQAVMTACRPQPNFFVKKILSFHVLSSTEWSGPDTSIFLPNVFIDISQYMTIKLKALKAYESEMKAPPHSRSYEHVNALASHHGHSTGVNAAEAFMLIREVI